PGRSIASDPNCRQRLVARPRSAPRSINKQTKKSSGLFGEFLRRHRPFIHVGHWAKPAGVACGKFGKRETGYAHEIVGLAIEVTTAGTTAPQRSQSVLPFGNAGVRRETMLDKSQLAVRLEHAPCLP